MTSGCNAAPEHIMNLTALRSFLSSVAAFVMASAMEGTMRKVLALQADERRRRSSSLYFFINIVYDPSQTPMKPTVLRPVDVSDAPDTNARERTVDVA